MKNYQTFESNRDKLFLRAFSVALNRLLRSTSQIERNQEKTLKFSWLTITLCRCFLPSIATTPDAR